MTEKQALVYPENTLAGHRSLDIIDTEKLDTLDALFRERVARTPDKTAYRQYHARKHCWESFTWAQVASAAAQRQQALAAEKLQPGDRVALRLRNGLNWVACEQAALGLGLVVVPLYVDDRADNINYILNHNEARVLIVEDDEHWQALEDSAPLPLLQRAVIVNSTESYDDRRVSLLHDWLPETFADELQASHSGPDDLATIVYTSGTTGPPKGVMLSHRNILSNGYAGLHSIAIFPSDQFLSFLPLSHTFERTAGYYIPMIAGAEIAFNRSISQLLDDLAEIKPTLLVSVPRIFERAYNTIAEQLNEGPELKRKLFDLAVDIGWQRHEHKQRLATWHPRLLLWPLLDKLVASRVRAKFGGRLRLTISGGAPLAGHVAKMFIALGIEILQGYGLTETSPVLSVNTLNHNDPDSIGYPVQGVRLRIGENDELLAQGPNVMLGYWKNEPATREMIDDAGWLHTGDCARIEDGFVYLTGRLKDILVLSNGEKLPPADIEAAISEDPLIEQVMVIGENKPYLAAICVLNPEHWQRIAARRGWPDDDPALRPDEKVEQLLLDRIARRMEKFPGYARIFRVSATLQPWTVENGILTPTLKMKRPVLRERFSSIIDQLYEGH